MSRTSHMSRRALGAVVLGAIAGGSAGGFALADASVGDTSAQATVAARIERVPPRIAAAFPALRQALDASEAQQLPAVTHVMEMLESQDTPKTGEANSELARRISQAGEDAEYLVPGNEVLCMVSIASGRATGGGCAPASSVETVGTTSVTVVPGGYAVTGILPMGTTDVTISDATGRTFTVVANANHAFHFFSAAPLSQLAYGLPVGGRHVGSLALPSPPDLPPPPGG
jgi:hypothetical protein